MLKIQIKNNKKNFILHQINTNYNCLIIKGHFGCIKKYIKKDILLIFTENFLNLQPKIENEKLKILLQNYFLTIKQHLIDLNYGYIVFLEMRGVGFKVYSSLGLLTFAIGLSHKVKYELPEYIISKILDDKNTIFFLMGNNRETVISTATQICSLKNIDLYKGKGIFFYSKKFKLKEGKGKKKI